MTSSVDWCERNYAVSQYVAEWLNTLSSLAMVEVGLVGAGLHRRTLERRFVAAFLLLAVVGVGSAAFHGTLRFELQMLDELPMLYLVALMVYVLVERGPQPRLGAMFPALLVVYAGVATYLCAFTRGPLQFVFFQVGFGALELFSLVAVWRLARKSPSAEVRRLFRAGIACYGVGILAWFTDLRFCAWTAGLPLHAAWHVLVSAGFYLLLLVIAHEREAARGRTPRWEHLGGVVPRLKAVATGAGTP